MEKCNNCERVIGNLERPYVFRDQVGCVECWDRLDAQARAFAALSTPPKPIEDPPKPAEGRVRRHRAEGSRQRPPTSREKIILAFLLCACFGLTGARHFYTGRKGTGVLTLVASIFFVLLTFVVVGWLGLAVLVIWWIVDLITILVGVFTDGDGGRLTQWT